jgi:hypothetical protein
MDTTAQTNCIYIYIYELAANERVCSGGGEED